jgi:hypothetical protein
VHNAPILERGDNPQNINLQEKQEGGSVLHMTNPLEGRISPHISWSFLKTDLSFFHIIEDH